MAGKSVSQVGGLYAIEFNAKTWFVYGMGFNGKPNLITG
jgi:hypothetical protein